MSQCQRPPPSPTPTRAFESTQATFRESIPKLSKVRLSNPKLFRLSASPRCGLSEPRVQARVGAKSAPDQPASRVAPRRDCNCSVLPSSHHHPRHRHRRCRMGRAPDPQEIFQPHGRSGRLHQGYPGTRVRYCENCRSPPRCSLYTELSLLLSQRFDSE